MVSEEFPGEGRRLGGGRRRRRAGADVSGLLAGFAAGSQVAGYRLEEQVGRGGMAVVFRARDERLGRPVALKILAPALATDEGFRRRFIRESRAAAAVDDPHIIPVFEAGEASGVLFIAMRYVPGGDVRTLIRAGPLPAVRAAAIIRQVASALDAAHGVGLVHRDVKPANMLVDARPGRADHVYLSDFGLSKGSLSSVGLTGTGQFLGTVDYISPEQVEGKPVDGRTDEYALACTAFELLTGTPPFRRDEPMAVMYAQLSEPPPLLTSRRPELPPALDQVFATALAKAPRDRYPSCRQFADALHAALGLAPDDSGPGIIPGVGNLPTEFSRPPDTAAIHGPGDVTSPAHATTAASARRPAHEADMAADVAGLSTASRPGRDSGRGGALATARPPRRSRHGPAARAAVSTLAVLGVVTASLLTGFLSRHSASHPDAGPPSSPGRGPPSSASYQLVSTVTDPGRGQYGVVAVAFAPDSKTLATGDYNGSACLWDVATGHLTAILTGPGPDLSAALSLDGTTLAKGDANGHTYLWDVTTRRLIATFADPEGEAIWSVAFSPNGKTLATGDTDGHTYLWDVATGRRIATLTVTGPGPGNVLALAFSRSGQTLATGDHNGRSYLWDVATGRLTGTLTGPGSKSVLAVAFSPDGKTLATGGGNGRTYLWDVATGRLTGTLTDSGTGAVHSLAFSAHGTMLAVGGYDGSTYLWDAPTDH